MHFAADTFVARVRRDNVHSRDRLRVCYIYICVIYICREIHEGNHVNGEIKPRDTRIPVHQRFDARLHTDIAPPRAAVKYLRARSNLNLRGKRLLFNLLYLSLSFSFVSSRCATALPSIYFLRFRNTYPCSLEFEILNKRMSNFRSTPFSEQMHASM